MILFGLRKRQAAEQDGVDQREHGVVGADAQREHDGRHEGKPAVLDEHTNRKADVLHQVHGALDVRDRKLDQCVRLTAGWPRRRKPHDERRPRRSLSASRPREVRATSDPRGPRADGPRRETTAARCSGATAIPLAARPFSSSRCRSTRVEPTPYQRDPSEPHVKRLMTVIEKVGRFLDPLVIVRNDDGYWTPNGNHRLQAMRKLGREDDHRPARAGIRRRVQDSCAQHREGAQREREVARDDPDGARARRARCGKRERPRVRVRAGAVSDARRRLRTASQPERRRVHSSLLRRIDDFLDESLPKAVRERERRAAKVLKLDDAVSKVVAALKERGLTSPYLKPFVIARVNPIRFSKSTEFDFDEVMDKMIAAATRFKVDRVQQEDVAKIGGAPPDEE